MPLIGFKQKRNRLTSDELFSNDWRGKQFRRARETFMVQNVDWGGVQTSKCLRRELVT